MNDLFAKEAPRAENRPLADRLRPKTLELFLGQEEILAEGKPLRREILEDQVTSYILWGPPGCGKTTLARLIAQTTKRSFVPFSAVIGGVKEVRDIVALAKQRLARGGGQTILFVDEVHRFNKSQQDAFLPHVEDGTLIFIGATTENPSFELNRSLLSRCRVIVLKPLSKENLQTLLQRSWKEVFPSQKLPIDEVQKALIQYADGDGRRLLNALEAIDHEVSTQTHFNLDLKRLADILQTFTLHYDRAGEEHYNVISAFIKSMRGSDPDAALHYLARMLEAGEDPRFIARRMMIFASEDIGNADPRALPLAVAAAEVFDRIGMPEGWIPLAQAVTFLSCAPKSKASYKGYLAAKQDLAEYGNAPVPLHLRNAPTELMKSLDYGKNYRDPHQDPGHINSLSYLPEALQNRCYYHPTDQGYEEKMKVSLQRVRQMRKEKSS